jgi:hypothetical protein
VLYSAGKPGYVRKPTPGALPIAFHLWDYISVAHQKRLDDVKPFATA